MILEVLFPTFVFFVGFLSFIQIISVEMNYAEERKSSSKYRR